jgi:formamidopyrimidine-DNA glycosylase
MSGDWEVPPAGTELPRHARAVLELDDGSRVALVDPRMLSTIDVHLDGRVALPTLGPEALDPDLDAAALRERLRGRRGPIKPVLLDQRVLAGLGNIYAAEALWIARISPRAVAGALSAARVERLLAGIREALVRGSTAPARYSSGDAASMHVYDREGEPCERCGTRIRRIVQAGRSTYFCPVCQRR